MGKKDTMGNGTGRTIPPSDGIQDIVTATSNYNYDDFPVELRVGGEVFKISSSRLAQHSPIFKQMFSLPQPDGEVRSIVLHNHVDEFKDFLWYIHADPFSAKKFLDSNTISKKCARLLGIALVAHMYDAQDVASQALTLALDTLKIRVERKLGLGWRPRVQEPFCDLKCSRRLLRMAGITQDEEVKQICVDVVCSNLHILEKLMSWIPGDSLIDVAVMAREIGNTFVLAHAYYYILKIKEDVWMNHPKLEALDRRRLLCGSYALHTRKEAQRTAPPKEDPVLTKEVTGWEPMLDPEIRDIRDSLWDMFDCDKWRLVG